MVRSEAALLAEGDVKGRYVAVPAEKFGVFPYHGVIKHRQQPVRPVAAAQAPYAVNALIGKG